MHPVNLEIMSNAEEVPPPAVGVCKVELSISRRRSEPGQLCLRPVSVIVMLAAVCFSSQLNDEMFCSQATVQHILVKGKEAFDPRKMLETGVS